MNKQPSSASLLSRPPVVAVLGHVDHGKTTLLDRIRKSYIVGKTASTDRNEPRQVAGREAGGITQSIGACEIEFKGQKITFIDTPGHAAFAKMRECGGQAADLAVLVVAADDGVMPQTVECLKYLKEATIPFLVAINKVDLPNTEAEKVKKQLGQNGVMVEGYGGDIVALPVSAKTGQGVDDLLEMIVLLGQMDQVKVDPEGPLEGVVIESKRGQAGPMITVVIKNGTLSLGEMVLAGGILAKVKGLFGPDQKRLEKVNPGQAAEVLGFVSLPQSGSLLKRANEETEIPISPEDFKFPKLTEEEDKKLKIILKADSEGSLEALLANIKSEQAVVISQSVGDIVEADVVLAQITKAKIWGFRVKVPGRVAKLAQSEGVVFKTYEIIYQFLEDLEKEVLKSSVAQFEEKITGKAQIIAEFFVEGLRIAGCRVLEGKISQGDNMYLKRDEKIQGETMAAELKQKTKKLKEAKTKEEFGLRLEPLLDFKVGDMLISGRFLKHE